MDAFVKKNPVLAMVVANVSLGLNSVLGKIGFESIPTYLFIGLRYSFAALLILSMAAYVGEKLKSSDFRPVVVQSTLQIIVGLSWYIGLTYTQAINSSIIFLLTPILVYVGSVMFLGEPRSVRALSGSLIALSGGVLMFGAPAIGGGSERELIGNGLMLVSATGLAAIILHAKKYLTEKNLRSIIGVRWLAIGTFALIYSLLTEDTAQILDASASSLVALAIAVTAAGVFGILLFYKALEHMRAEDSASLFYIDTLTGSVAGAVILGETLSDFAMIAASVIIIGVLVSHPIHMNRYIYYRKLSHSRFDQFLHWAHKELDSAARVIKRYI